jgi:hypothetical protein
VAIPITLHENIFTFTNMKDILLLLCHYPYSENTRDSLTQLLLEVHDWTALVHLINAHGIIALSAYNIKKAGLQKMVPEHAMALLENGLRQSMVRNAWLTERWKEVNTILENAGIRHILLKGMALEHTIYGSAGLRQMNDNDIFINPENSIKAWHLLQENGFRQEPFKSPLFKKMIFNFGNHLPALYKDGYALEIHDNLFENETSDDMKSADLFSATKEINIYETRAFILSKEMQLKHLTDHFNKHLMSGDCQLRLYTDIILLDKESSIQFPDNFIDDPIQSNKSEFRKKGYKATIRAVAPQYRLRFIIGDTFPTLKWMMKRYKCGKVSAIVRYPARIGKWWWLV